MNELPDLYVYSSNDDFLFQASSPRALEVLGGWVVVVTVEYLDDHFEVCNAQGLRVLLML